MVISGTDVEQLLNLIMRYYQKSEFTEILEASCQLNYDRVSNGSCYRYGVYNSIINCEHLGQNPFQRFISGVKVNLLTDSRVLYYLFSSKVGDSSVKIRRWCLKLISDYPTVVLHFIKT
ncbi:MAG: hypothetical protein RLZZ148_1471, partial [Cyanobacteriota bacterium]